MALGRKEWLEDSRPNRLVHAAAGIADGQKDVIAWLQIGKRPAVGLIQVGDLGFNGEATAPRLRNPTTLLRESHTMRLVQEIQTRSPLRRMFSLTFCSKAFGDAQ